jgi:hypothetical protein
MDATGAKKRLRDRERGRNSRLKGGLWRALGMRPSGFLHRTSLKYKMRIISATKNAMIPATMNRCFFILSFTHANQSTKEPTLTRREEDALDDHLADGI